MFSGILIALLVSLPILTGVFILAYEISCYDMPISLFCTFQIVLISIIIGSQIGIYLDQTEYEKQINSYIITKQTIENAIQDNNTSDLEKIELLRQVSEENEKLERLKVDVNKWYNFYLDKSKIENLEPIKLK